MSRNNALFASSARPTALADSTSERMNRSRTGRAHLVRFLTNIDGPDHLALRRIVKGWFTPARMGKSEAQIRQTARDTVGRMASRRPRCDLVGDVALRYPLWVLMALINIPAEDEESLLRVTRGVFGAADRDLPRDASSVADGVARTEAVALASAEAKACSKELTETRRRRQPADDLASSIAGATVGGARLTGEEAFALYMIIATAGRWPPATG